MLRALDGPAVYGNISVITTAIEAKVGTSVLAERSVVTVQPIDGDIYYGYDNSVTITTGTKIIEGQTWPFEAGEQLHIYLIAEAGTVDVRITEVS